MKRFAMIIIALGLAGPPPPAAAQSADDWTAGQMYATRAQLEQMLAKYRAGSNSSAYSDAVRSIAGDEAELIRLRLENGDFEVGDVITLTVGGQTALTADFILQPGYLLVLPDIREPVPLKGVLRSELRQRLVEHLSKYLVDPQVYVQTKVTIRVEGDVGQPGFHTVAAESRITEVLATSAGQPNATAKLDRMKVKRGDETIWEGDELEQAILQGRTIDQLNMRAGDTIEVPGQGSRNWTNIFQAFYYVLPVFYAVSRIF